MPILLHNNILRTFYTFFKKYIAAEVASSRKTAWDHRGG